MKQLHCLGTELITIVALGVALGCSGETTDASERGDVERGDVQEEVSKAWDAMRSYTYNQRDELEGALAENVARWDTEMDELTSEAGELAGDARVEVETRISALEDSREELATAIGQLEDSTQDAWGDVRDGIVDSMENMERGLEEAWARLRKDG